MASLMIINQPQSQPTSDQLNSSRTSHNSNNSPISSANSSKKLSFENHQRIQQQQTPAATLTISPKYSNSTPDIKDSSNLEVKLNSARKSNENERSNYTKSSPNSYISTTTLTIVSSTESDKPNHFKKGSASSHGSSIDQNNPEKHKKKIKYHYKNESGKTKIKLKPFSL